jgi:CheY-like chemotaxis protein
MQIMIADDSRTIRTLLRKWLSQCLLPADTSFFEVDSGEVALTALQNLDFDLVLLDFHMPVLDGLEVLEALASRHPMRRPRVVMISSDTAPDLRRDAEALGVDGFLPKPVKAPDLHGLLAALFPNKVVRAGLPAGAL